MKPLVYYYCLDLPPGQVASTEASLRELQELMKHPPREVDCPISRLPDSVWKQVSDDLECLDKCVVNRVYGTLTDQIGMLKTADPNCHIFPRLIICCSQQHPLAKKCLIASPKGLWGVAYFCFALVYKLTNPCAIWHELLHLLRADDCYDTENPSADPGPTCEHRQCIMQYAATEDVVDGCLPLCNGNVNRITKLFAKIKD